MNTDKWKVESDRPTHAQTENALANADFNANFVAQQ